MPQYTATVRIQIEGNPNRDELANYLQKAVTLDLDTETGMEEGTVTAIEIDWETLKKRGWHPE